ncbi:MAG: ADP-ribosylation factor-like protein [Candidatus Hodarchaeota archaeon]
MTTALIEEAPNTDVTSILNLPPLMRKFIGQLQALKLRDGGIKSIQLLAKQDPQELATKMGINISITRKWVTAATIVSKMELQEKEKKKVVIAGLDYAGKSSIIKFLKREQVIPEQMSPTIGASNTNLTLFKAVKLICWDLGGQKAFRDSYFEANQQHFLIADILIYVIDRQQPNRFFEAINYLVRILQVNRDLGADPEVFILFHKSDPSLMISTGDFSLQNDKFFEEFEFRLKKILPERHEIFYTSLYNRSSLFNAFSTLVRRTSSSVQVIDAILEDLAKRMNALSMVILDKDGFVISEFEDSVVPESKELLQTVALNILQLFLKLETSCSSPVPYKGVISFPSTKLVPEKHIVVAHLPYSEKQPIYCAACTTSPLKVAHFLETIAEIDPWLRAFFA